VEPLFRDWLTRELPERASRIINRIKDTRQGELNDSRFGVRMSGEGEMANAINNLFEIHADKYKLTTQRCGLSTHHFRREVQRQIDLFGF